MAHAADADPTKCVCHGRGSSSWRRSDDVFVSVPPGNKPGVLEDVEGGGVRRARNVDMWCPVAELLIGGNGGGQYRQVDVLEKSGLRLGNIGRGRADEPGPGLA